MGVLGRLDQLRLVWVSLGQFGSVRISVGHNCGQFSFGWVWVGLVSCDHLG